MKIGYALLLMLLLSACQGMTINSQAAAICESYNKTLATIVVFQSKLTSSHRSTLKSVDKVLHPGCLAASTGGEVSLGVMRSALRRAVLIEQGVK